MYPAKPNIDKKVKGGFFGKVSFIELLKNNEQIRTTAVK
jgi:hypothetical protein